jgi:hypothetical protein
LEYIRPSAVQTEELKWLLMPEASGVLMAGPALSVWQSGKCLGAAGVVPVWKGRAEAWAVFADGAGFPVMRACVKSMSRVLNDQTYRRIDMLVRKGNGTGHTLARLLNFEYECTLEAYHVTGDDMYMYKRIKK